MSGENYTKSWAWMKIFSKEYQRTTPRTRRKAMIEAEKARTFTLNLILFTYKQMLIHGTEFLENNFFEKFNITLVAFVSVLNQRSLTMKCIWLKVLDKYGSVTSVHIYRFIFFKKRGEQFYVKNFLENYFAEKNNNAWIKTLISSVFNIVPTPTWH